MGLEIDRTYDGTAVLTLARPRSLNALDAGLMDELYETFAGLQDDPTTRVVVLTGAGSAFCAGMDIKDFGRPVPSASDGPAALLTHQRYMSRLVVRLRELPQPVIAAVNGVAVGGGMALACAADIRIASPEARFGVGAVRLGLSGGEMGLSYHLPRLVGMGAAADWMLTGRLVDAAEAARTGLVGSVVDGAELLDAALALAAEILGNSPYGVRMTKQVMWDNLDEVSLAKAVDREDRTQVAAFATEDSAEAWTAVLERRPPRFTDR
jgi:enoyl-CoA hydratase